MNISLTYYLPTVRYREREENMGKPYLGVGSSGTQEEEEEGGKRRR